MEMTAVVSSLYPLPQTAQVDINIRISASLNITPYVAKRKVNALVLDRVGTGVYAEEPELIARDEHLCWRVPVVLSLPTLGYLGQVGTIEIDAQTGEVLAADAVWEQISTHAEQLVNGATLQAE